MGDLTLRTVVRKEMLVRLADFIEQHMHEILVDWDEFAVTLLPAASSMSAPALRDHAEQILKAIAADLRTTQSREEQAEKSKGRAPKVVDAPETAAETHAVLRARSGFDINQLASEYRALRASIVRRWLDAGKPAATDLEDLIRLNEAIDQALVESINFFSEQVNRSRALLLGMLGHDMRSPVHAIRMTATFLTQLNTGDEVSQAAQILINSGARIQALLDDLILFNRTNLGLGVPIAPADIDLAEVLESEMQQLRAAHPERQLELQVTGNGQGHWDARRVQQMVSNLVENAIKYGAVDAPIRVIATDAGDHIQLEVRNRRLATVTVQWEQVFAPLEQGGEPDSRPLDESSLGLGLYIVREIAKAHGGNAVAATENDDTVFAIQLPRAPAPRPAS